MSRVANWNPMRFDMEFAVITENMLRTMAGIVAANARAECPVGTVSRPMYRSGPYANQPWTARDAGQLIRSIRVVEKHDQHGVPLAQGRNVRVYAGNYLAYYARIVERTHPQKKGFMRKALNRSREAFHQMVWGKAA